MKKSYPSSIPIMGKKVSLEFVPANELIEDKIENLGTYDPETRTIKIDQSLPPHRQIEIFIHEYTHGLFYLSGQEELYEQEQIESICNLMEHLSEVLKVLNLIACENGGSGS